MKFESRTDAAFPQALSPAQPSATLMEASKLCVIGFDSQNYHEPG
ncbi:hypothetical protein [Rhodoferax koreensis]|nr:hypothetical protein [Rhodoferax koreense]